MTLPPCTLWESATWFGLWLLLIFRRCLQLVFYIQWYSDTFYPLVADRRATARTTETLSHAAFKQKKRRLSMPPRCQPRLLLPPLTCTKSGVQMVTPGYWEMETSWACPKTSTSKSSVSTTQKCAKQEVLDTPIQTCFIISIERISLYSSVSKKLNPKSKRHLQRHPRFRMACAHHCFWKAGCNTSTATVR